MLFRSACAVALENIDIIEREKLVERVANETGPYLQQKFAALRDHPLVGDAESCGFVAGLVLAKAKAPIELFAPELEVGMICRGHCFANGLVMRAVGDRMIIAPPLVMTVADVDELVARITKCLDLTLADVRARGWM